MAPPAFKTPLICRVLSRVIETTDLARLGTVSTNLGMSRLRFEISGQAPANYFFGAPDSYAGEHGALLVASHLSQYCDAFIDIGANHGYFSFFVYGQMSQRIPIHYFEPDVELFAELSANVRRLALEQVYGHCCAIGASSGQATFYTDLSDRSSSSLTRGFATLHRVREAQVTVCTFDEFVVEHGVKNSCVKVDIECAEFDFLRGAVRARDAIRFLIIEVLGPAIDAGFVQQAKDQLGMHAYYINDLQLEHSPHGSFVYRPPQYNWLFCRESPDELRRVLRETRLSVVAAD
jgi:FkbM family methyltransferase